MNEITVQENLIVSAPENLVALVGAVIDESGSMTDVRSETIQGYNSFIANIQKEQEGKTAFISTFTFDFKDKNTPILKTIQSGNKLHEAVILSESNYNPFGYTPLYDAIGQTIVELDKIVKEHNVDKITLLIQTDGDENRSSEFKHADIKKLIEEKKAAGWQIIFLGADLENAKEIGIGLGVASANTMRYSKAATSQTFDAMAMSSRGYRNFKGSSADIDLTDEEKKNLGDV